MSGPHNRLSETHWTNPYDEHLLSKHLIRGDKEKCTLSQPKRRAYKAKASTPLPWIINIVSVVEAAGVELSSPLMEIDHREGFDSARKSSESFVPID
jgi:hypothetical protein